MIWANHGIIATTFIVLYVAHQLAGSWLQIHTRASSKDAVSGAGRLACARHVLVATYTQAGFLVIASLGLGMDLQPGWVAAGLWLNAMAHYTADRRTTLIRLADWLGRTGLVAGKGEFARLGDGKYAPTGTGAHALAQSWHLFWLLPTTWICVVGPGWGLLT